jgi:hypothetical protein
MRYALGVAVVTTITVAACSPAADDGGDPAVLKTLRPVIITAKEWGSKPQAIDEGRRQTPRFVTIHHAGEVWKEGTDPVKKIQALQAWGQREKKWPDLPYHFLVAPDGRIFEGRDVRYEPESNTKYELKGNVGVMLWGNFEEQRVSRQQLEAAVRLTAWLCSEHGIEAGTVRTHQDVAQTACPGKDLYRYFQDGQFQRWVEAAVKGEPAKVELREAVQGGPTELIPGAKGNGRPRREGTTG